MGLTAAPDCIPCTLRQILSTARRVTDDEWLQTRVLTQVMSELSLADLARSPAEIAFDALKSATRLLGRKDVYADDKRRDNETVRSLLPDLRRRVAESDDPVGLAARAAIAGNIIDLGILSGVDAKAEVERALDTKLVIDDTDAFREAVRSARDVLYVLDNAGEAVLDRLLIEQLKRKHVTCLVRAEPILNDVTAREAREIGLDEVAEIIDPGAPMLGLVLTAASPETRRRFEEADLVIAKGHANFETLAGAEREIFFMLRAKCAVVAGALGVRVGDACLCRAGGANAPRHGRQAVLKRYDGNGLHRQDAKNGERLANDNRNRP